MSISAVYAINFSTFKLLLNFYFLIVFLIHKKCESLHVFREEPLLCKFKTKQILAPNSDRAFARAQT